MYQYNFKLKYYPSGEGAYIEFFETDVDKALDIIEQQLGHNLGGLARLAIRDSLRSGGEGEITDEASGARVAVTCKHTCAN